LDILWDGIAEKGEAVVNIVMLARNRHRLLEQAFKSLHLHTSPQDYNLTIVDDGSDDFRACKLFEYESFFPHVQVVSVHNSPGVLAQLKNVGVAASENFFGRGDYLYLSDCDVYFTDGWLEKLIALYEKAAPMGFRLLGGQVHPFHKPIQDVQSIIFPEGNVEGLTEHDVLDGPSWLMKWGTWQNYGPFNRENAPGPCQSEEYPFCQRLRSGRRRIGAANPWVVIHTGLTQTDGKTAPGAKERAGVKVAGVLYE
jgi:glycosyltransferase involved in cell wall biosynthesis